MKERISVISPGENLKDKHDKQSICMLFDKNNSCPVEVRNSFVWLQRSKPGPMEQSQKGGVLFNTEI